MNAQRKKIGFGTLAAAALLVLFAILATLQPRTLRYPYLEIDVPAAQAKSLSLTFLIDGQIDRGRCERTLHSMASSIIAVCPLCKTIERRCLTSLTPEQNELLSEQPLNTFSARLPNGITLYQSADKTVARLACEESARQSAAANAPVKCFAPGELRPIIAPVKRMGLDNPLAVNMGLVAIAFLAACFTSWLIIRFEHIHSRFSHDHIGSGPQKFHAVPTSRIGGLALIIGLLASSGLLFILAPLYQASSNDYVYLLIAAMPAFLGGLTEDVTKKVSVLNRLLLTMVSATVGAWLLGAILFRLDIPGTAGLLAWLPVAILFTAFAVGGVTNSINIIDGYNGLAAGYAVIVLAAFAWVGMQTHDLLITHVSLSLIGALAGFLVWNWPRGRIFLGDGGAYLLGFLLAELAVLLVARNPEVSPAFPLLVLAYPIFETLFSIYRRKLARGHSPGRPDALHLHHLIYFRLVRGKLAPLSAKDKLGRNSHVAPFYWITAMALGVMGVAIYDHTAVLLFLLLLFCMCYLWLYTRISTWRSPPWLIRRM